MFTPERDRTQPDDDTCEKCKDGAGLVKCKHCVDSNCASCGLWCPTDDDQGGCNGLCSENDIGLSPYAKSEKFRLAQKDYQEH